MTQGRIVPVGSNPKAFVRTDRVIGMRINRLNSGENEHVLTIHMDGMPEISIVFDSQYEAAQAACQLSNKINETAS